MKEEILLSYQQEMLRQRQIQRWKDFAGIFCTVVVAGLIVSLKYWGE